MPLHVMKAADVMKDLKPGRYGDGGTLFLHVRSATARSWVMLPTVKGKREEISLGAAAGPNKAGLSLDDAREKAADMRRKIARGEPLKPEPAPSPAPADMRTFEQVADEWFDSVFANEAAPKTVRDARSLVKRHAKTLLPMDVRAIMSGEVEDVLRPIWGMLNRSANDLRLKLETIFAYAAAKTDKKTGQRYRDPAAPNPADWKVLKHVFPDATPHVQHHESVPYTNLPGVMRIIQTKNRTAARALEFTTLCAVRTAESRGARWQEVDFDAAVWTIPAERMKVKKVRGKNGKEKPAPDHRVPLSSQALALLRNIRPANAQPDDLIFPGDLPGQMMGMNAMTHTLQRVTNATPHGMRSSFSTWRAEKAKQFDYRLAEAALAHVYKSESEAAYNRSDMLEERRPLMQAWADYLDAANVT